MDGFGTSGVESLGFVATVLVTSYSSALHKLEIND
jgi:hypothetical protein